MHRGSSLSPTSEQRNGVEQLPALLDPVVEYMASSSKNRPSGDIKLIRCMNTADLATKSAEAKKVLRDISADWKYRILQMNVMAGIVADQRNCVLSSYEVCLRSFAEQLAIQSSDGRSKVSKHALELIGELAKRLELNFQVASNIIFDRLVNQLRKGVKSVVLKLMHDCLIIVLIHSPPTLNVLRETILNRKLEGKSVGASVRAAIMVYIFLFLKTSSHEQIEESELLCSARITDGVHDAAKDVRTISRMAFLALQDVMPKTAKEILENSLGNQDRKQIYQLKKVYRSTFSLLNPTNSGENQSSSLAIEGSNSHFLLTDIFEAETSDLTLWSGEDLVAHRDIMLNGLMSLEYSCFEEHVKILSDCLSLANNASEILSLDNEFPIQISAALISHFNSNVSENMSMIALEALEIVGRAFRSHRDFAREFILQVIYIPTVESSDLEISLKIDSILQGLIGDIHVDDIIGFLVHVFNLGVGLDVTVAVRCLRFLTGFVQTRPMIMMPTVTIHLLELIRPLMHPDCSPSVLENLQTLCRLLFQVNYEFAFKKASQLYSSQSMKLLIPMIQDLEPQKEDCEEEMSVFTTFSDVKKNMRSLLLPYPTSIPDDLPKTLFPEDTNSPEPDIEAFIDEVTMREDEISTFDHVAEDACLASYDNAEVSAHDAATSCHSQENSLIKSGLDGAEEVIEIDNALSGNLNLSMEDIFNQCPLTESYDAKAILNHVLILQKQMYIPVVETNFGLLDFEEGLMKIADQVCDRKFVVETLIHFLSDTVASNMDSDQLLLDVLKVLAYSCENLPLGDLEIRVAVAKILQYFMKSPITAVQVQVQNVVNALMTNLEKGDVHILLGIITTGLSTRDLWRICFFVQKHLDSNVEINQSNPVFVA